MDWNHSRFFEEQWRSWVTGRILRFHEDRMWRYWEAFWFRSGDHPLPPSRNGSLRVSHQRQCEALLRPSGTPIIPKPLAFLTQRPVARSPSRRPARLGAGQWGLVPSCHLTPIHSAPEPCLHKLPTGPTGFLLFGKLLRCASRGLFLFSPIPRWCTRPLVSCLGLFSLQTFANPAFT